MSSNIKTLLFATTMCVVCGLALTFAATALKPFQEYNKKIDQQKNILKVLGITSPNQKYSSEELGALYDGKVSQMYVSADGQLSEDAAAGEVVYLYKESDQLKAYAIPISGYGLWSTLYGYFSLESDGETVKGITFYQHGETPGLGAEVEQSWFQNNFVGKKIVDAAGAFVSIGIVKGAVKDVVAEDQQSNYVDGISGATVTSVGVEKFLKTDLSKYEAFSAQLRRGVSWKAL